MLNALLVFACGDECDIEEILEKHDKTPLDQPEKRICQESPELFNRGVLQLQYIKIEFVPFVSHF